MKALFIFGTRPEAIKMAPLVKAFSQDPFFKVRVCVSGQHRSMLDQVLEFFDIKPEYDINVMKPNQTLFDITADTLKGLQPVLEDFNPDVILVQGDTTTALVGALGGFYKKVKIAHIEAGLRSANRFSPYPEEVNRVLIGRIADYHFVPTEAAKVNLEKEGVKEGIHNVGNSVIDALFLALTLIEKQTKNFASHFSAIKLDRKIVLITGHRRESFGEPFQNICEAIKELALDYPEAEFVYPVHFNPNVRQVVNEILINIPNVHLIEPLDYPHLVWLMNRSYLVLTDSGGIQEEAPSLGKPVLVMREVTERQEGIDAGTAVLVGTRKENITAHARKLLDDSNAYQKMAKAVNPYGDGKTSQRIVDILKSSK
ncbi:MAG: non-hydrolyzing UDP-N-acetylglucosamine 2-epimerase [Bacteroidota bacterium]